MSDDCGCCGDVGAARPGGIEEAPGRASLSYRVGTHESFRRAMTARLSAVRAASAASAVASSGAGAEGGCLDESHQTFQPGGTPEAASALLDGWACVADVLTFYQERIANEGYLRTATERRSLVEMGRLTGYAPRPGVAASAWLAFTVQDGFDGEVPAGTKVQSSPRPGQTAQTFETSAKVAARAQWNAMAARSRATGVFVRTRMSKQGVLWREIFLKGVGQGVQAGDVVLLRDPDGAPAGEAWTPGPGDLYRISRVTPESEVDRTTVRMIPLSDAPSDDESDARPAFGRDALTALARARRYPRRAPGPRPLDEALGVSSSLTIPVSAARTHGEDPDAAPRDLQGLVDLLAFDEPRLRGALTSALRGARPPAPPSAWVFRASAHAFGHNASRRFVSLRATDNDQLLAALAEAGFHQISDDNGRVTLSAELRAAPDEAADRLFLDGEFPTIRRGDYVVVAGGAAGAEGSVVASVLGTEVLSRHAYGLTARATRLDLSAAWWRPEAGTEKSIEIAAIRRAVAYVRSEALDLVAAPILEDVAGSFIDLDHVVDDLDVGRWLVVEGERTDVPGVAGIRGVELARVARTETREEEDVAASPGRRIAAAPYTRVHLAEPLDHAYRRVTAVVRGNLAHATHGETRDEVLGSGDASRPGQTFSLRQGPRTWVSAPTPSGVASTLEVRVNGVLWPEAANPSSLGPRDEVVLTRATGDGRDEVRAGDGARGARLPTGVENVAARYRVGIGAGGNVDAGLIRSLVTQPMGVQEVTNPLRASGGSDPDGADAIRARIPVACRASDRLVSVRDHADFALNFAGIAKAGAWRGADPSGRPTVTVVIAGDEGAPIDATSDLYRNLRAALFRYGDPATHVELAVARAVPLAIEARVRLDPRYAWAEVEPALRERLYARLGWEARDLGEAVHLSRALEALRSVPGVAMVDVGVFGPLSVRAAAGPRREVVADRVLGLRERLAEAKGTRVWRFRAAPDEVFYFARAQPLAMSLAEVSP